MCLSIRQRRGSVIHLAAGIRVDFFAALNAGGRDERTIAG
jgi:hypothetical protein